MNIYKLSFIFTLLGLGLIFGSCLSKKPSKKIGVSNIEFGSGGGFTGRYLTYKLNLDERNLEKPDGSTSKIKRKAVAQLVKKISAMNLKELDLNAPNNMNQFIHFKGDIDKKLIWGKNSDSPEDIKELYTALTELTK